MANRLTGIYGTDENGMAQRISGDALRNTAGKEDVWGGKFDQEARSKGNSPIDPGEVKSIGNKNDSRAKTEGNHGIED